MVNLIEMRSNWLGGGAVAYGTAGEHTAIERRCDRDVMDGEIVGVVDALARNGLGLPWWHIPGPKSATARSADRQLVETEFRTMVITSESVDIFRQSGCVLSPLLSPHLSTSQSFSSLPGRPNPTSNFRCPFRSIS